jgi:hypothetical protein
LSARQALAKSAKPPFLLWKFLIPAIAEDRKRKELTIQAMDCEIHEAKHAGAEDEEPSEDFFLRQFAPSPPGRKFAR